MQTWRTLGTGVTSQAESGNSGELPLSLTHTRLEVALSRGRVTAAARGQYTREKSLGLGKKIHISHPLFSQRHLPVFVCSHARSQALTKANIDCGQPGPSLCASRPHHRGLQLKRLDPVSKATVQPLQPVTLCRTKITALAGPPQILLA